MAKSALNIGSVPNDNTGDNLRSGAIKINSNFDEIYTYFGDGSNLTGAGVSIQSNNSHIGTTRTLNFGTGLSVSPISAGIITVTSSISIPSQYWVSTSAGVHTTSNVGIGTTIPLSALHVLGDARISGVITATDFNSTSDIKLKKDITVIENPLDKIIKLEGVNFKWKENDKQSMGVIAQKVEEVLPQLVFGNENKTVNYNGIIGLLIECIKKQQEEIEEIKKIINK